MAGPRGFHAGPEQDRHCYESIIIVLDTLERCLANQPKDTTKYDEAMNVKLLLREICQFIGKFLLFLSYRENIKKRVYSLIIALDALIYRLLY